MTTSDSDKKHQTHMHPKHITMVGQYVKDGIPAFKYRTALPVFEALFYRQMEFVPPERRISDNAVTDNITLDGMLSVCGTIGLLKPATDDLRYYGRVDEDVNYLMTSCTGGTVAVSEYATIHWAGRFHYTIGVHINPEEQEIINSTVIKAVACGLPLWSLLSKINPRFKMDDCLWIVEKIAEVARVMSGGELDLEFKDLIEIKRKLSLE